jgi:hypothetical protein
MQPVFGSKAPPTEKAKIEVRFLVRKNLSPGLSLAQGSLRYYLD